MIGVICFTIITFVLSIVIVILNDYLFKRKTKKDKLLELLPGYNCGVCGFGSCSGMCEEIIKDKNAINKCKIANNKDEILKIVA